jgi:hypothetical protein
MTYIKVFLPTIDKLKEELENNPEKIWIYQKYNVYLGDIESIRFLQQKINELQNENGTYIR